MTGLRIPRVLVAAAFGGALAAAGSGVDAQRANSPQPEMYRLAMVSVKPDQIGAFVDHQIKEYMPAMRKAGIPGRQAYSTGAFGDQTMFAAFSPVKDLAELDGPGPLVKALGEAGAEALNAKTRSMFSSYRVMLVRTRPDLSYVPDPKAPPAPLAVVTEAQTVPGRRPDFEAFLKKDVVPLMSQAKVRSYSVLEVVMGSDAGTYFTSIGYDSHAAIGKGHPFDVVLGPGGSAKIEAKGAGLVRSIQRSVVRYRPDLSYATPAGTSN